MSFLTRWDDDTSRPSFGSALRDAVVRAVLPGVGVFAVIVAIGRLKPIVGKDLKEALCV